MNINVVRINPNGTIENLSIPNTLEGYYEAIGNGCDMVQQLYCGNGIALLDEEAKVRADRPPNNPLATWFFNYMDVGLSLHDKVVGAVILCGARGSSYSDITPQLLNAITGAAARFPKS